MSTPDIPRPRFGPGAMMSLPSPENLEALGYQRVPPGTDTRPVPAGQCPVCGRERKEEL